MDGRPKATSRSVRDRAQCMRILEAALPLSADQRRWLGTMEVSDVLSVAKLVLEAQRVTVDRLMTAGTRRRVSSRTIRKGKIK